MLGVHPRRRRRGLLLLGVLLATTAACGEEQRPITIDDGASAPVSSRPPATSSSPVAPATLPSHPVTLYDKPFSVDEGLWDIGFLDAEVPFPRIFPGRTNGLLGADRRTSLVVSTPGLYGRYPTRIELHPTRPRVPSACEDVVEVPYEQVGDEVRMASFDTSTRSMVVPAGSYRVRLCVTGLDIAAQEDEFTGDDYTVYSSHYLFQLWPAAVAPARIVRTGSDWARRENARVAREVAAVS